MSLKTKNRQGFKIVLKAVFMFVQETTENQHLNQSVVFSSCLDKLEETGFRYSLSNCFFVAMGDGI